MAVETAAPPVSLSKEEVMRYSRHLIIPDVGMDGQKRLKNAKVLIDASGATLMATTVMNYIQAMGTVAPTTEGRITRR